MKKILVLFLCLLSIHLKAQNTEVKVQPVTFDNILHDFGTFKEEGGDVEHKFIFTNNDKTPIKIDSVFTSCGCTTSGWTKAEVPPGGSGFVTAKYNPLGRPLGFIKSLAVYFNSPDQPQIVLIIKGEVTPKPKSIADTLYTKIGGIRVLYQTFNFGEITNEKPFTKSFDVYNESEKDITFMNGTSLPTHLEIKFEPQTLKPRNRGKILITYDPVKRKELGYLFDAFNFSTDEATDNVKQVYAVATIREYFPPMSAEELAKAPKLVIDNPVFDFGQVKQGEKMYQEFFIRNEGKSTLVIRSTKAGCGCTVSQPDKSELTPGEASRILITYTGTGEGQQEKTVSVFSNDPLSPTQVITIKMNVVKAQ